ncbi:MAG: phosphoribosylformylglycinamidine cyclo-ligase [Thermodesulfobacteriota bacterium]
MTEKITYKDAGVDIDLADRLIGSLQDRIKSTFRPEVMGKMGGFAALVRPDWSSYREPVLVSATDGVGTKLKLAFLTGIHDTVGIDLVAMSVNDVLVTGAEPLFFLDYFATGGLEPATFESVVSGIVRGCRLANCALIGGETAEMPDFYSRGEYDLAGFCVGVVDRSRIIDGARVKPGNVLVGLASSGLHSNGFSLVRRVLLDKCGYTVESRLADLDKRLGEELLTPTVIYVRPVLQLFKAMEVLAVVHITGGGFYENIPRVLPDSCDVLIHRNAWDRPRIFEIIRREAGLDEYEMYRTFNMGVGMVLVVSEQDAQAAIQHMDEQGIRAWIIGKVTPRSASDGRVSIE